MTGSQERSTRTDGGIKRKRKSLAEAERDAADPWLTLAEIADELRVNPATVRQWASKGQLKASRAGVRKWIVRRSELDRMLAGPTANITNVDGFTRVPAGAS